MILLLAGLGVPGEEVQSISILSHYDGGIDAAVLNSHTSRTRKRVPSSRIPSSS